MVSMVSCSDMLLARTKEPYSPSTIENYKDYQGIFMNNGLGRHLRVAPVFNVSVDTCVPCVPSVTFVSATGPLEELDDAAFNGILRVPLGSAGCNQWSDPIATDGSYCYD